MNPEEYEKDMAHPELYHDGKLLQQAFKSYQNLATNPQKLATQTA